MSVAIMGVLKAKTYILERLAFGAVAILLIFPTAHTRIIGIIFFLISYVYHRRRSKSITRQTRS
jgi:TRAP-type uncharacterized transport system fused permease subunit